MQFQNKKMKEYGYSEGVISESFMGTATLGDDDGQEGILALIGADASNEAAVTKAVDPLVFLGQATGDGECMIF